MKEILYYNGTILTLEEPLLTEAVLTCGGKIKMTGKWEELKEQIGKDTCLFDLQGKTMLPAFIDSHSHMTAFAKTLAYGNLTGVKSFQELKDRIIKFAETAPLSENEWVIAFGYDQNMLLEKRHPDKHLLDSLGLRYPILISHVSGHMGVMDSKALAIAGITKDSKDPAGGKLGRIEGTEEPNGYLEESAFMQMSKLSPSLSMEKKKRLLQQAQKVYASYGITTVQDGLLSSEDLEMLKACNLYLDTVGYIDIAKHENLLNMEKQYWKGYQRGLRLGGIKLILDGSPQGRTAWLTNPYEGTEDYRGYPVYTDKALIEYYKRALTVGVQILTHCNGDAAAEQMIRCFRKARQETNRGLDARPVMIHAQLLRVDLLPQIQELGIIPSYFVAHTYYWGDIHKKNLGKRAEKISPAKSTEKMGICYTFHQDTPVLPPDMLKTIWCAVNRITKDGVCLGKEEAVTPLEALKAVTINGAFQYFEEKEKGSIAPGKDASFVILSQNPLEVPPLAIDSIEVEKTIQRDTVIFEKTVKDGQ